MTARRARRHRRGRATTRRRQQARRVSLGVEPLEWRWMLAPLAGPRVVDVLLRGQSWDAATPSHSLVQQPDGAASWVCALPGHAVP